MNYHNRLLVRAARLILLLALMHSILGPSDGLAAASKTSDSPASPSAAGKRPNIVIILADDLGYGSVGCYGATKLETPNIDRLAREGIRFTNAYAPSSVCTPTRYNLLTGRYAWRYVNPVNRRSQWDQWHRALEGDRWIGHVAVEANEPLLIEPGSLTLPSFLKEAGYQTACVGKWHLGFGKPNQPGWIDGLGPDWNRELPNGPLDVGFDYYFGCPIANSSEPKVFIENRHVVGLDPDDPIRILPAFNHQRVEYRSEGGEAARIPQDQFDATVTQKAVEWLRRSSKQPEPFFLFLPLVNPHWPFAPPPEYAGTSRLGPRGDVIHEMDGSVGEIMRALEELGVADNTLLVFASDNGAQASSAVRHEHPTVDGHALNGPLLGQKTEVHEGAVRVPLVLRWPAKVAPSQTSEALVALTDLLATCSEIIGQPLPQIGAEDSFSFANVMRDGDAKGRREGLVVDSMTGLMAYIEGPWKYIPEPGHGGYYPKDPGPPPPPDAPPGQLYNLEEDSGETRNRYTDRPEIVAALSARLDEIVRAGRSRPIK